MRVKVRVPSVLRDFSGGSSDLEIEISKSEANLSDVFDRFLPDYVGVRDRTLDEHGAIRRHINVFLNGESVKDLEAMSTPVKDGDDIWIIPAVSGGQV